ncbi:MAG: iron chaperone [Chitinophagaceae bacterium]
MDNKLKPFNTIDEYIVQWPEAIQAKLQTIRETVKSVAPGAEEVISYQMPTFKEGGILIHFAAFSKHYSLFPGAEPIEHFANELKDFETSKGTIKIPMEAPVPVALIKKLVKHRQMRIAEKASLKKIKK